MFGETLDRLCNGDDLGEAGSAALFSEIMNGRLSEVELSAALIALKTKGETPAELAGAARALREAARPFPELDFGYADSCGTGGDGAGTVNISTAVALVVAEAGLPVAKHGNRSISSKCGSADVLEACGLALDATPELAARCLTEERFCFLFAPGYHSGMRHAMPVRRALATRTIFNLLGPLCNPARPRWQVLGVYHPALCRPMAETLGRLGCEAGLVVHGSGLDEIALHGPTTAALWRNGALEELTIHPADAGLKPCPIEALAGGEREQNARWLRETLSGRGAAAPNAAIAINAGALLWIAGRAADLASASARALEILAAGKAIERLERVGELSRGA